MKTVFGAMVALSTSLAAPARAEVPATQASERETEVPSDAGAKLDERRADRVQAFLPFSISPRIGERPVTGHFWGGYAGGARGAVGDGVVDGTVTRFLAVRVGANSSDLWGRTTAVLGARFGILRDGPGPFDLGVGAFYQPNSIRGDGLVTGNVSFGKQIGRLSTQATVGYGQDPEGDDGFGMASLGGAFRVAGRTHAGIQSRARFQLWTEDPKFVNLEQPVFDFSAGPLLAYALGPFDLGAQAGLSGLMLRSAPGALGASTTRFQLGPLLMLGVGATL